MKNIEQLENLLLEHIAYAADLQKNIENRMQINIMKNNYLTPGFYE